jgi:predicted GIY-YIG superfamily endonuclease
MKQDKKEFIVYAVLCPLTSDIVYIGRTTKSIEKRWKEHLTVAKSYRYEYTRLYIWLGLLKKEKLFDKVEVCAIDYADNLQELKEKEAYWIKYFHSHTTILNHIIPK